MEPAGRRGRPWRRRRHVDHARPGVREGRRQYLDGPWLLQPGIPQEHAGSGRGRPVLGGGNQSGRAYALAAGPGGPYEHAPYRDVDRLVRRRRRPDADVPGGAGRGRFPRRTQGSLRRPWAGLLRALQGMVRPLFLPAAPGRAARHRRHLLRQPGQRRLGGGLRVHARCRTGVPGCLSPHRPAPHERSLDARAARAPVGAARAAMWNSTFFTIAERHSG